MRDVRTTRGIREEGEDSHDLVPLLQSREFAYFLTVQERVSLGLPEQWTDKVARLADETHVVVVIDSLDVLSIAREHGVLMIQWASGYDSSLSDNL